MAKVITQIYGCEKIKDAQIVAALGADHIGASYGEVPHLPFQKNCAQAKEFFEALPDNVVKVGLTIATDVDEIINDLHRRDFIIIEAEEKTLTREEAEAIYSCHKDKPFFEELIEYMTSGPCIGMVLLSPFSDRVSAIEALNNLKTKYRRRYGIDNMRNVIHTSDCYQSVVYETEAFFHAPEYRKD